MKLTKTGLALIILFVLALLLRLTAANYFAIGSDEMIYTLLPLNIMSAGRLSTVEQAPLYFYLVDLGYILHGNMTLVSGRYPSIIFGAFTVLLVFLIAMELFRNKTASLLSAFFAAVSGYAIFFSQEMDMAAYFFALLSMLFFCKALKPPAQRHHENQHESHYENQHESQQASNNESSFFSRYFYASTAALALAVLMKPIVLLFLPAYLAVFLMKMMKERKRAPRSLPEEEAQKEESKKATEKKVGKNPFANVLIGCFLLAMLLVAPVLSYNFLLYKEKGVTDYYFSVLAGVGDKGIYAGQEAESWTLQRFLRTSRQILFGSMLRFDALLLIFGIAGILFSCRKKSYCRKNSYGAVLLVLSVAMLLLFLAGKMGSGTHYVWIPIVFSIFAGPAVLGASEYVKKHFRFRYLLPIIILLALLSTTLVVKDIIPHKKTSFAVALQEYADEHISPEAVIVLDPRIYRGVFAWAFHDKHYLEGTFFQQFTELLPSLPGGRFQRPFYYIECGPGTNCGWKPEDFQRIYDFGDELSSTFRRQIPRVAELQAIDTFYVYKGEISIPESAYEVIDRTHLHWYTPVGWKYPELATDYYALDAGWKKALHYTGLVILYIDVILALFALVWVVYMAKKEIAKREEKGGK